MTEAPPTKRSLWDHVPRHVRAGLAVGALGTALWLVRWLMQREPKFYTQLSRLFYLPNPELGCKEAPTTWVWLGLEGLGIVAGLTIGTLVLVVLVRATDGRGIARVLRFLAMAGGALAFFAPVLPVWAFVSGMPPAEAYASFDECPKPKGALDVAATRFMVAAGHEANQLVVKIDAGNETFDARFPVITGEADLAAKSARFEASSKDVTTGVGLRDEHARGYLKVTEFPTITLAVHDVVITNDGSYTARGTCTLLGKTLEVPLTGTVSPLGDGILATGSFTLSIAATPLDPKNFDSDRLVVTARVALVPAR